MIEPNSIVLSSLPEGSTVTVTDSNGNTVESLTGLTTGETYDVYIQSEGGQFAPFITQYTPDGESSIMPFVMTVAPTSIDSGEYSDDGMAVDFNTAIMGTAISSGRTSGKRDLIFKTDRKQKIKAYDIVSSGSNGNRYTVYGSDDGVNWTTIATTSQQTFKEISGNTHFNRYGGSLHAARRYTLTTEDTGYLYHKFVGQSSNANLFGFWLTEAYWAEDDEN